MSRFFLAIGIAAVITFGALSAFYSGGEYAFNKPALEKQILTKIYDTED